MAAPCSHSAPFPAPFNCIIVRFGPDSHTSVFKLANLARQTDIPYMPTLTLPEAQQNLPELVRGLGCAGEWVITEADKPVAKLSPATSAPSLRDLRPKSVGAVLRPFPSPDDDTLGEMLDARP